MFVTALAKQCLKVPGSSVARSSLAAAMVCLLTLGPFAAGQTPAAAPSRLLSIEIVDGEDAINNIKLGTAREPIIEVQDENHRPVSGAVVTFSLAHRSLFSRTTAFRATTDSTGRVRLNPLQLNHNPGRFEIHVKASYQGRTATIAMHQTNVTAANTGTGATASTAGATPAATAGVAATAVGVTAAPVVSGVSVAILAIAGAAAVGATVGSLAATGVIGGGGKSATVSVGMPHF